MILQGIFRNILRHLIRRLIQLGGKACEFGAKRCYSFDKGVEGCDEYWFVELPKVMKDSINHDLWNVLTTQRDKSLAFSL